MEQDEADSEDLRAIARHYHGSTVQPVGFRDSSRICDSAAKGLLNIRVLKDGRWAIFATRKAGRIAKVA